MRSNNYFSFNTSNLTFTGDNYMIQGTSSGYGINIDTSSTNAFVAFNILGNNTSGEINDAGTTSVLLNNQQWAYGDASGRTDVGKWLGTAVTLSATTTKPEIDLYSISDDATAADNLEALYESMILGQISGAPGDQSNFNSTLSASNNAYDDMIVMFRTGNAAGESRWSGGRCAGQSRSFQVQCFQVGLPGRTPVDTSRRFERANGVH